MTQPAARPGLSPPPDRPGDRTAGAPSRITLLIGLVLRLVGFGKHLTETVQQRATSPGFSLLAQPFGTLDIRLILARIARGVMRAMALEALLRRRAARGQDIRVVPVRAPHQPHGALPAAQPAARPASRQRCSDELDLSNLPTSKEIAAEVRRRPIGAVIADICADFGIMPGGNNGFGQELSLAVILYGGNLLPVLRTLSRRSAKFSAALMPEDGSHLAWLAPNAEAGALAAVATGPP
ncbi:MAG TPA: hypothetical protein VGG99_14325 [Acetobacteraceae bacterium]